jgi:hypothetical protein
MGDLTRITLETGGWWEVEPGDMEFMLDHARAYVASKNTHPEGRERVKKVWLDRQFAPAWRAPLPERAAIPQWVKDNAKRIADENKKKKPLAHTRDIVDRMLSGEWRKEKVQDDARADDDRPFG